MNEERNLNVSINCPITSSQGQLLENKQKKKKSIRRKGLGGGTGVGELWLLRVYFPEAHTVP